MTMNDYVFCQTALELLEFRQLKNQIEIKLIICIGAARLTQNLELYTGIVGNVVSDGHILRVR